MSASSSFVHVSWNGPSRPTPGRPDLDYIRCAVCRRTRGCAWIPPEAARLQSHRNGPTSEPYMTSRTALSAPSVERPLLSRHKGKREVGHRPW